MEKIKNTYTISTSHIFETMSLIKRYSKQNNVKSEIIANKSDSRIEMRLEGREMEVLTVVESLKHDKLIPFLNQRREI